MNFQRLLDHQVVVPNNRFRVSTKKPKEFVSTYQYFLDVATTGNISKFSRDLDSFLRSAKKFGDTVLLSQEFLLDPRVTESPENIHHVLMRHFDHVEVVYYVRRQDEFILSGWQQWRHKLGFSLVEDINRELSIHRPDYLENIRYLESIYGRSNVVVRPFDRQFFAEGDLVTDFCVTAGFQPEFFEPLHEAQNVSINPYICEIFSLSSKALYDNDFDNEELYQWLLKQCEDSTVLWEPHKEYMTPSQRALIMEHFERDNRVIHEEHFDVLNFEELFGPKSLEGEYDEIAGIKQMLSVLFEIVYKSSKKSKK